MLIYPRAIFPSQSNRGSPDTPWFIVFKPCPVSLLRGAVPVGRVEACATGKAMTTAYFDANVLYELERMCPILCAVG